MRHTMAIVVSQEAGAVATAVAKSTILTNFNVGYLFISRFFCIFAEKDKNVMKCKELNYGQKAFLFKCIKRCCKEHKMPNLFLKTKSQYNHIESFCSSLDNDENPINDFLINILWFGFYNKMNYGKKSEFISSIFLLSIIDLLEKDSSFMDDCKDIAASEFYFIDYQLEKKPTIVDDSLKKLINSAYEKYAFLLPYKLNNIPVG